jgi:hypothetical protein
MIRVIWFFDNLRHFNVFFIYLKRCTILHSGILKISIILFLFKNIINQNLKIIKNEDIILFYEF